MYLGLPISNFGSPKGSRKIFLGSSLAFGKMIKFIKNDVKFICHECDTKITSEHLMWIRTPDPPITGRMLYQLSCRQRVGKLGLFSFFSVCILSVETGFF